MAPGGGIHRHKTIFYFLFFPGVSFCVLLATLSPEPLFFHRILGDLMKASALLMSAFLASAVVMLDACRINTNSELQDAGPAAPTGPVTVIMGGTGSFTSSYGGGPLSV